MNIAKNRQKWITALRSGKYPQTTCTMKSDDGKYCVLGVLREVTTPWYGWWWSFNISTGDTEAVGKLAGLSNRATKQIVYWNDNRTLSFNEFADELEILFAREPK